MDPKFSIDHPDAAARTVIVVLPGPFSVTLPAALTVATFLFPD